MKDVEYNTEKEETIQWEEEKDKKATNISRGVVTGKAKGELGREETQKEERLDEGREDSIKEIFLYFYLHFSHIRNENNNLIKQEKN